MFEVQGGILKGLEIPSKGAQLVWSKLETLPYAKLVPTSYERTFNNNSKYLSKSRDIVFRTKYK